MNQGWMRKLLLYLDINDVNNDVKLRIKHFFEHYKDLEKGKWVKILGWEDIKKAKSRVRYYHY